MRKYFLLISILATFQTQAALWYVNGAATGLANGTTWTNAFPDIASAISASNNGDSIWVAAGTYKPSATLNTVFYNLKSGVSLYGGFAGTETFFTQRNVTANLTILSGDIGVLGYPNDNSLNIFKATNLALLATVDGFTIKDAYRSSGYGAGALVSNSNVLFENCKFLSNNAQSGAGIYFSTISPSTPETLTIINCTFDNNVTYNSGAAVFVHGGNLVLKKSVFSSNISTSYAGALRLQSFNTNFQTHVIDRCLFTNNRGDEGGAIYGGALNAKIDVTNCLFAGNFTQYNNVVYLDEGSSITTNMHNINNCTFANNTYDTTATGNSVRKLLDLESGTSKVSNSIVWQNKSNKILDSTIITNNNIIQNGITWGTNNINVNPNFSIPSTFNTAAFVATPLHYTLKTNSPAINFGDNLLNITSLDLFDSMRVQNSKIDLGCFENIFCSFPLGINVVAGSNFCAGDTVFLQGTAGQNFYWNITNNSPIFTATNSGIYNLTSIDTITGCRGDTNISLSFINPINQVINPKVCVGQNYTLPNGTVINNVTAASTYTNQFTSAAGCDSIIFINLSTNPTYNISTNKLVCNSGSYTFPDGFVASNITSTITHTSNLVTAVTGCDSIINTTVNIALAYNTTDAKQICYGSNFTFYDGTVITNVVAPTSHVSNLLSSIGCDSMVTTNITLTQIDKTVTVLGSQLKANQNNATYKWFNCDTKQLVNGATNQTFTPSQSGNYAVIVTVNGCKDSSICNLVIPASINDIQNTGIVKVYPNPNNGIFETTLTENAVFEILSIEGKVVYKKMVPAGKQTIDCSTLTPAIYTMRVYNNKNFETIKLEIK
jgi:hypothetical protein